MCVINAGDRVGIMLPHFSPFGFDVLVCFSGQCSIDDCGFEFGISYSFRRSDPMHVLRCFVGTRRRFRRYLYSFLCDMKSVLCLLFSVLDVDLSSARVRSPMGFSTLICLNTLASASSSPITVHLHEFDLQWVFLP